MATSRLSDIIEHLRRTAPLRDGAGLTDGQLLENYLGRRDEAALAALVWRHGPMVWSVCHRVLHNHHDAEDAFQATFLVFVRKAGSIASRELLANWLYGVAYKTSMKARGADARRKGRERQVAEMPEPAAAEQQLWRELQPILDQELSRLPDKYRAVIVQCELDGKTRKEAALQLGVPEGTIASRMATARAMLAKRLARYGLALSCEALAVMLSQNTASAGLPTTVASATIQAATLFAAGQAATGVISPEVATLTQGTLKAMLLTKLKIATAAIVLFVLVGGAAILTSRAQEGRNDPIALKQVKEDDIPKDARLAREPAQEKSEERFEGKPVAYWIELLQRERNNPLAIEAVKSFSADAVVPVLLGMLDDNSSSFRQTAAEIFGKIGAPVAKTAVPTLLKSLKEGHAQYPDAVVYAIGRFGPEAKDAIPVLIQALQDNRLSQSAVYALCQIGPSAKEALPAIGRAIRAARARKEDRGYVFWLGGLGEAAIPHIVEFLEEKDAYLKSECATALGAIGPTAKRTVPKLEALLKHDDPNVRMQAAMALWRIEKHAGAIPMLAALLKEQDLSVALGAAHALREIGPDAKIALPELKEALKDERTYMSTTAREALREIEPGYKPK